MQEKEKRNFRKTVYDFYRDHGRHDLPWRKTYDPYCITVSEIMLQQTQVQRVIPKYNAFLKAFPHVQALAQAPLSKVLEHWSGLGYNRRAKFLHEMAKVVTSQYKGIFPQTVLELRTLPGIGPYTAQAIAAFAYNIPGACIETNIRTVYIHHFFNDAAAVSDADLLPYILETLDTVEPRTWYAALMDYGSHLKQTGNKVHRKSSQYIKQTPFKGSRRHLRGAMIRRLLEKPLAETTLIHMHEDHALAKAVLGDLVQEGFIVLKAKKYSLII
jgi:A/G-specific adenine glycosylase